MRVIQLLLLCLCSVVAMADTAVISRVGIIVGSLENPFYQALVRGAIATVQANNAAAQITTVPSDFSLSKQIRQINSFVDQHVDLLLLVAADPVRIGPAVQHARAAGVTVVAVDVEAAGAEVTVTSDNVQAGELVCGYLAERMQGKGRIVIQNGPGVSSVLDRVRGCHNALKAFPDIVVLNDSDNALASRWGGQKVMTEQLQRYPHIDAVFCINDPEAIGADAALAKADRPALLIGGVDGSPDIEKALKRPGHVVVSASQDPYLLGARSVMIGLDLRKGNTSPPSRVTVPVKLVTRDNIATYRGWTSEHPASGSE